MLGRASLIIATLSLAGAAACGDAGDGASSTGGSGGAGTSSAGTGGHAEGGGDPSILVGAFQVTLKPTEDAGLTTIAGRLYDGPTPANIVWEAGSTSDGCVLLEPRVPFCNPTCGGSAVCVEDDLCQPYPEAHGAGVVTVTGLATASGETSFDMQPIAENYQAPAGTALAYPPFSEGDVVTLSAAGGFFAPFTLDARGVQPLVVAGAGAIPIDGDAGATITWNTPGDASLATVRLKLDVSHHGGSKGKIECQIADTGSFTIAPSLIAELLALGVSGFPTVVLSRESVGSTTIEAGRVDLVITSAVERAVAIEGLTSCTTDDDCPDGQTCQGDLKCG